MLGIEAAEEVAREELLARSLVDVRCSGGSGAYSAESNGSAEDIVRMDWVETQLRGLGREKWEVSDKHSQVYWLVHEGWLCDSRSGCRCRRVNTQYLLC